MGLIQGAYCLSPTGMLASMSEEVKKPEQTIPRAMCVLPCDVASEDWVIANVHQGVWYCIQVRDVVSHHGGPGTDYT